MKNVPLVPVASSNVAAVGYDAEARALLVKFTNGAVFRFADVPAEKHVEMMKPGISVGSYFISNIKRFHKATKVAVDPPEPKGGPS